MELSWSPSRAAFVITSYSIHYTKLYDGQWTSRRLLLKHDDMGFSMHDTLIHAGSEIRMWYKNHLEAVYCVSGEGEIEDIETGEKYRNNFV